MKQFFLYLALLLGVLIGTDRALAFLFDRVYASVLTGQSGGKINHYLTLPRAPELVIMGNSRALYQVNPASFPVPGYNLCHAGMSQVFQTGLLDIISRQPGRLPRAILLHLDPFDYTKPQDEVGDIQNLKFYFGRNPTVTRYVGEISAYEPYKYWFDSYRYNGRVVSLFKNAVETRRTPANKLGNGYVPLPPAARDSFQTLVSARRDTNDASLQFHPERLRYLDEFIGLCRRNHVQLVCFTSPVYPNLPYAQESCRQLGRALHERGVPYVDYINRPLLAVVDHPHMWRDSRHLNELGARLESRDLARRIAPLLATRPKNVTPSVVAAQHTR